MALAGVLSTNVGLRRLNLTDCYLEYVFPFCFHRCASGSSSHRLTFSLAPSIGPNLLIAIEANRTLERLDIARGNYSDAETFASIESATVRNRTDRRRDAVVAAAATASSQDRFRMAPGRVDGFDETESLGSSFARRLTVGGLIEERVFDEADGGGGGSVENMSVRTGESASVTR
jgi:hypothetical protein